MSNLKKVLALALVFAMALSMGAFATDTTFSDTDTFKNEEAVYTMNALGIIAGFPDGTFRGDKSVTRAEMAKMIYVLFNGGVDDGAAYYKTLGTPLTDISGHWAEGYIKFNYSMGIIAGKGNNNFAPDESVTGLQEAKMLLVLLGYDAEKAGLVGNAWGLNTASKGAENGFFKKYADAQSAPASRDGAAQMIYNALSARMVIWSNDTDNYKPDQNWIDLGDKFLSLKKSIATLTALGNLGITGGGKDGNMTVTDAVTGTGLVPPPVTNFTKVAGDYSALIGQQVRILWKDSDDVYGVFATGNSDVTVGVFDDLKIPTATNIDLDDDTFDIDAGIRYSDLSGAFVPATAIGTKATDKSHGWQVNLIDSDNDGDLDYVVRFPFMVSTIASVTSANVVVANKGSYEIAKIDLYEGAKADDVVVLTEADYTFNDKDVIAKAELVKGEVDGVRTGEVRIDGKWYSTAIDGASLANGDTVEFYAAGKYLYYVDVIDSDPAVEDLLYIEYAGVTSAAGKNTLEAKAYFSDGTSKVISISKLETTSITTSNASVQAALIMDSDSDSTDDYLNRLFSYELDGSDYEIKAVVNATNKVGFDGVVDAAAAGYVDERLEGMRISDTGVFFIEDVDGVSVITGKELIAWGELTGGAATAWTSGLEGGKTLYNTSSGIKYAGAGYLVNTTVANPGASGDESYGYLVAKPTEVTIDKKTNVELQIFTGTETETLYWEKSLSAISVAKGDFVLFKDLGDSKCKDVYKINDASNGKGAVAGFGAITGWDKSEAIVIMAGAGNTDDGSGYAVCSDSALITKLTKDTKVIYVNDDKTEGVAAGSVAIANKNSAGKYVLNCFYYAEKEGKLSVIFVDVLGNINEDAFIA